MIYVRCFWKKKKKSQLWPRPNVKAMLIGEMRLAEQKLLSRFLLVTSQSFIHNVQTLVGCLVFLYYLAEFSAKRLYESEHDASLLTLFEELYGYLRAAGAH